MLSTRSILVVSLVGLSSLGLGSRRNAFGRDMLVNPESSGVRIALPTRQPRQSPDTGFRITRPVRGDSVSERPTIEGAFATADARIWLVVHPMEISNYYVQPAATVRAGGTWRSQPYIGRPGSVDQGKHFEIRAFANPVGELHEGQQLDDWPASRYRSQLVEVVRK